MSFFGELYEFLIGPIELIFEIIFSVLNKHIFIAGVNIVILSFVFSLIVLPLYLRADKIQEEARDTEERLAPVIKHIKEYFKGDERFMILQTYYRQNDYSPLSVLKSSVSLLLQVPFFLAAYRMLNNNVYLVGVSFGPIANLGAPDALLKFGTFSVNVLPFVMTAVNLISAAIYANKMPTKSKIQLWIMAGLFLVLLYQSPSGMVLYWTCNNLFSLIKNIIMKIWSSPKFAEKRAAKKAAKKAAKAAKAASKKSKKAEEPVLRGKKAPKAFNAQYKTLFIFSCLTAAIYAGFYLPVHVLASAPQEFVNIYLGTLGLAPNPTLYLLDTFVRSMGLFVLWPCVFCALAPDKGRRIISYVMFALDCCFVVNSQFFSNDFGTMDELLEFDYPPVFDLKTKLISVAVLVVVMAAGIAIAKFGKFLTPIIAISASVAFAFMGGMKIAPINEGYEIALVSLARAEKPEFKLSKNGKNVVVLMLDRAIGPMVPYFFNEKPELAKEFDGFTYYHNALSYGIYTNFGTPGLYGGYEYTPEENNKRSDERLVDKQNEALKVMPQIFANAGYNSTFINPSYAGYQWYPDTTIFDDCKGVKAYSTLCKYMPEDKLSIYGYEHERVFMNRLFAYSVYKVAPYFMQKALYDKGDYNETNNVDPEVDIIQRSVSHTYATGNSPTFEMEYYLMDALNDMTQVDEGDSNNFMVMSSRLTHEIALLKEPEYEISNNINNSEYDNTHLYRFFVNGGSMQMKTNRDFKIYQSGMCAYLKVAKWLKYLKDNDCYDNTRIILVSDHGRGLQNFLDLMINPGQPSALDAEGFACLLMVKDFDSHGEMVTSEDLMTNADTPYLAFKGLIDNPTNPFTGKEITEHDKSGKITVFDSDQWNVEMNNGNTFLPGRWYSVHDNIYEAKNWKYLGTY